MLFNEQVRRNRKRFPADFMFQLTAEETSSLRSQFATLKVGRGQHRKYLPYVFTEQGASVPVRIERRAGRAVAHASNAYGYSARRPTHQGPPHSVLKTLF
jgi:hypothetical protein